MGALWRPDKRRCEKEREDPCRPADRPGGKDRPPRVKEEPIGVWLVLRYDIGDAGARPIPNGEVFWLSPDIWISGGDALGNAIAGKATGVHARVWNFGAFPATPTRVDFRFVDPSIGVPWTAPKLIGTAWVSVPPLGTAVADCPTPWVPAATGSTHACLIVTCASPLLDPAVNPGDVRNDRKTAQRNVTIVQVPAGKRLDLDFLIGRTLAHRGRVEVAAMGAFGDPDPARAMFAAAPLTRTLRLLARRPAGRQASLLVRRALALHTLGPEARYRQMSTENLAEAIAWSGEGERDTANAMAARGTLPQSGLLTLLTTMSIEPLTQRPARVSVSVPREQQPFVLHLFQFEDGLATGGYTVIVLPT